ncbi:ParB/RepB/Spo0J family partition protein [Ihubacter sp. rT4E-8]|uniref:ParB/RepB/Spo0J family partition protein n=1 Tax=Ihubacter sp. rT4E-8 TaxID=3242369 RepID=UPI003CEA0C9F
MAAKTKNRGLGRGLDALFADQAPTVQNVVEEKENSSKENTDAIQYINIHEIKPNENQPRKVFNEEKISELAASITEHGIIQPLVVRKQKIGYEIVAGERRWRAARKAELKEVPCLVRSFTDEENMLIAIIENMQREDLNPIEEAEGLHQMIKIYGMTQEEVSKSVSKSRPYITNSLRLLKLPEEIQNLVTEGKLTTGHARALIPIEDKVLQAQLCRRIIEEGLSVRKIEELASGANIPKKRPAKKIKSADMLHVERQLKDLFGTKVSINQKGKKGSIQLEYYSTDELNRLIELLKSVEQ